MALEFSYSLRHLLERRVTTILTLLGISLVVFVFVASQMLGAGLKYTLAQTGSPDNIIITRHGSRSEVQSSVPRAEANIIATRPEIERNGDQTALITADSVVLISLKKRDTGEPSNVSLRGTTSTALRIRNTVHLVEGRAPNAGTRELMVGKAVMEKYANTRIGESLHLSGAEWPIVGIFDAGQSAFSSELWGDTDVVMAMMRRDAYSSITAHLAPGASFETIRDQLENDRRLSLSVQREVDFYAEQSKMLSTFIIAMGAAVSIVFSLGAITGAMVTFFSAVASRTREIGILRALGFSSWNIIGAFLREALLLSLAGGIVGLAFAALLTPLSIVTTNFQTFSGIAFGFRLTPTIAIKGLVFSAVMGVIGGGIPAWRASRISILNALRG